MPRKSKKKKEAYVLIDSNIYLEYFRMSSATGSSLGELLKLLEKRELKLVLPKQVEDEYWRNKEQIIAKTKVEIQNQIPRAPLLPPMVRELPETQRLQKHHTALEGSFKKLLEKYDKRAEPEKLIESIFTKAERVEESAEVIRSGYQRYIKGNPPRKDKRDESYGDALIWETLLAKFTDKDLAIVSQDKDWYKNEEKDLLKEFLVREWKEKSKHKLTPFKTLAEFLNWFTGKEVVKKKVVEEESAPKQGYYGIPGSALTASSVITQYPSSALDFMTIGRRYYCPNPECRKDITVELSNKFPDLRYNGFLALSASDALSSMVIGGRNRETDCPYCRYKFNLDNL